MAPVRKAKGVEKVEKIIIPDPKTGGRMVTSYTINTIIFEGQEFDLPEDAQILAVEWVDVKLFINKWKVTYATLASKEVPLAPITTKPDYVRAREIAEDIKHMGVDTMMQVLNHYINMGGDSALRTSIEKNKVLHEWHPTLQQCLMRGFIKPAIIALSAEYSDDRNASTVAACQDMKEALNVAKFPLV